MTTITIPRLLVAIAQAPFGPAGEYDPELAQAALEGAVQHFIHGLLTADYDALAKAVHTRVKPRSPVRSRRDVIVQVLCAIAVDGDAAEFSAGGATPLEGITFAFEDGEPANAT